MQSLSTSNDGKTAAKQPSDDRKAESSNTLFTVPAATASSTQSSLPTSATTSATASM
jgi:hypothetical protein